MIEQANLNFIDVSILLTILYSVIMGLLKGLVSELVSLATLVAAVFIAVMFSSDLAAYFTQTPIVQAAVSQTSSVIGVSTQKPVSYVAIAISFGVLFFCTILVGAVVRMLLNIAVTTGFLGMGNRLLGGVFGLARGSLIALVIIFLVQLTPISKQPVWHNSQVVVAFQPAVVWLGDVVSPSLVNLKTQLGTTVQNMGSSLGGK